MRFNRRILRNNQVTIPNEIIEAYKIKRGDIVEFEVIRVKKT